MGYRLLFLFLLPWTTLAAGGGGNHRGSWQVVDSGTVCITFNAQIDLDLSYIVKGTQSEEDVSVAVPSDAVVYNSAQTVDHSGSTCNGTDILSGTTINTQVLSIKFGSSYPGWNVSLYFTNDKLMKRETNNGQEWVLYRVDVGANYTAKPNDFKNSEEETHIYTNLNSITIDGDNEFAQYIYADLGYYLYCPSKQKYIINGDEKNGPLASITFQLLEAQAYQSGSTADKTVFGTKSVCPTDQHTTDKVPIIVGGSLAGLIILTMVLYLVYRAFLPEEVIHLTNPHSHHENKAMTWDDEESAGNHHHS